MKLTELVNQIMPKMQKLLDIINDDRLVRIEVDEAYDNAILLTFQEYNGCVYLEDKTYQMRALIGAERIIYENPDNGHDFRDILEGGFDDISVEEYDAIMNL